MLTSCQMHVESGYEVYPFSAALVRVSITQSRGSRPMGKEAQEQKTSDQARSGCPPRNARYIQRNKTL